MKMIAITSTAILSLVLGVAAAAYAQHEELGDKKDHAKQQQGGHDKGKSEPQRAQKPEAQHTQPQGQERQQQSQRDQQQPQHNQQQHAQQQQRQDQNDRQQHAQQQDRNDHYTRSAQGRGNDGRQYSPQQQRVQRSAWQQHRSQNWQSDHRNWQQRGGYRGYRVPEYRYRGYFGPSHGFRIGGLPFLVVGGYPRFQYQGYWISAVDPWPSGWGDDWYDNDDVYVSYEDNGYYMYNRSYPGQGIAINITF
jgi:hypothetical protein